MTSAPPALTEKECVQRALTIRATADALRDAGDEWAAVCYFYSAYHMVKAAFMADPIFNSISALTAVHPNLVPGDRGATSHQGHFNGGVRVMGVNDIVRALYPKIAVQYIRLHMASVHVRYQHGLGVITMASAISDYNAVRNAYVTDLLAAVY
jgi:hypothetical protein